MSNVELPRFSMWPRVSMNPVGDSDVMEPSEDGSYLLPRMLVVERLILEGFDVIVTLHIVNEHGRPELNHIEFRSMGGSITGETLEGFPFTKLVEFFSGLLAAPGPGRTNPDQPSLTVWGPLGSDPSIRPTPRRRGTVTDELLREVARIYKDNGTGTPTQAVADEMTVPYSTASRWVGRARKKGLLPPTTPGRRQA